MNTKAISFIIPCYNCEKTLKESIDSILKLNLPQYEICLTDDGSKDSTYEIMKKYQSLYPSHIKIAQNPFNVGGATTRNRCFEMTVFDYVFCLDSDNVLDKTSFLKMYENINENTKISAFQRIKFFYAKSFIRIPIKEWIFKKKRMDYDDIRKSEANPVASGNYLFAREVFEKVKGYETDLGALDAFSFGYKALAMGYIIDLVENSWYYHRLDPNSYWLRESEKNNHNLKILLDRYDKQLNSEEKEALKTATDTFSILINKQNDFSVIIENKLIKIIKKILGR